MKYTFLSLAIIAIIFSACVNNSSKHTHEDGTEHVNHKNETENIPQQESFEVTTDSVTEPTDTLKSEQKEEHSHDNGHKHTH